MEKIHELIKNKYSFVFEKNTYLAPEIPERQLNNAIKKMAPDLDPDLVVLLFDNSLLKDGKEGILFTGTKLIYREALSGRQQIDYANIEKAEFINKEIVKTRKNGEKNISNQETILITLKAGNEKEISGLQNCNYKALADLLHEISNAESPFEESSQLMTLSEMNADIRLSYMKILINFTLSDDGEVDPKEYAELLSLMVTLDFSPEERIELRTYINSEDNRNSNEELIAIINNNCPAGNEKALHVSLVKDLLNIFKSTKNKKSDECAFLHENKDIFNVSDEEIEFAEFAIDSDRALLNKEVTNDQLKKNISELAAKAGAVGVPIAAVYMSGSVVGLSAAGITSGLATLGFGGILGFSGMVTGIGLAVLLGVGAYKGVKKLSGSKEIEQQKKREAFLQKVIEHTQLTINILVEDVNYMSSRLMDAIKDGLTNELQIKKLSKAIAILSNAGTVLTQKSEHTQIEALKTKCPNIIDVSKISTLTKDPTKKKFYDEVLTCYEEVVLESENGTPKNALRLKKELNLKQAERLSATLEAIGYFSIQGTSKDLANKGKERLKDFLK